MKNLILLSASLLLLGTACKKENKAPTPAPAPNSPAAGMTATETALVGKWYWDHSEQWIGGVLTNTYDSVNRPTTKGCFIDLRSTFYQGVVTSSSLPQSYDCIALIYYGMTPGAFDWEVFPIGSRPKEQFMSQGVDNDGGGDHFIDVLTSTNLVFTEWTGSIPQGMKIYYHK